eukprot:3325264-Alexandrium_andersonii.AAC.1
MPSTVGASPMKEAGASCVAGVKLQSFCLPTLFLRHVVRSRRAQISLMPCMSASVSATAVR